MAVRNLILITGLPGSGKTTLAEELNQQYRRSCVIHLDDGHTPETLKEESSPTLIIEGLLSGSAFYKALDAFPKLYQAQIIRFADNIEACLHNDRLRARPLKASASIRNMKITVPTIEELEARYPGLDVSIELREVTMGNEIQNWALNTLGLSKYCIHEEKPGDWRKSTGIYFYGDSWSLGGTYGNCWNDTMGSVDADPPKTSFDELDLLLEQVAPQLSLFHYKALYRTCVETVTYGESDYYGGYVSYARFVCDLTSLHKFLTEYGYIN